MKNKTISFVILLFTLLILGMFIFAYLANQAAI